MKKLRNLIRAFACLLILALGGQLASCAFREKPARTENGEVLFRLGFSYDAGELCPYTADTEESAAVLSLVYDSLFEIDPDTGLAEGALCSEWSAADGAAEGTTLWKLTLREGVVWHDGEPLTARDVEFSLQSLKDFSDLYGYPYLQDIDTTGIAVEDDTHLAFLVWGNRWDIPELLSRVPILPAHIWNRLSGMSYSSAGAPSDRGRAERTLRSVGLTGDMMAGSGPFVWTSYEGGVLTLKGNGEYWRERPEPGVVQCVFNVPDAAGALLSRRIDACWDMSEDAYQQLVETGGYGTAYGRGEQLYVLGIAGGGKDSLLRSENVRTAIDYCVDRAAVLHDAFGGGVPTAAFLPKDSPWDYGEELPYTRDFSVESANWLLETTGFRDRDGDGIRDAGSSGPLSFRLICSAEDPAWKIAAESIRDSCAEAGIELRVSALETQQLLAALDAGDYDLYLTALGDVGDPCALFRTFYSGGGEQMFSGADRSGRTVRLGWDLFGYDDPEFDRAFEAMEASSAADAAGRVRELGIRLFEKTAAIPIGFSIRYQAVSPAWVGAARRGGDGAYFSADTLRQQILQLSSFRIRSR